jgi:hypothetical protein
MSEKEEASQFNLSISGPDFKFAVGLFAMVGLTLGLTGAFAFSYFNEGGATSGILTGLLSIIVLTIGFLLGPVVAMVVGLRVYGSDADSDTKYTTSGIGSFVGYIVMIVVLVLVLTVSFGLIGAGGQAGTGTGTDGAGTAGDGGGVLSIGDLLLPLIGFAIPTGIMGVGATWLASRFGVASGGGRTGGASNNDDMPTSTTSSSDRLGVATEGAVSKVQSTFDQDTRSSLNDRIRSVFGEVSYLYAIVGGILSLVITSVMTVFLVGADPALSGAERVGVNLGIARVDMLSLYQFGLEETLLARVSWLSWLVLIAHGVTIDGVSLDLLRIELIRAVPVVVLVALGYLITKFRDSDSLPSAFIHGASLAVGYVLIILVMSLKNIGLQNIPERVSRPIPTKSNISPITENHSPYVRPLPSGKNTSNGKWIHTESKRSTSNINVRHFLLI